MRNIFTIAGREFRSIFTSPVAYVVLTGFLLLSGWFFFNLLARFNLLISLYSSFQQMSQNTEQLNLNQFVIAPLLQNLSVILIILIPMVTMRSLAEEKRTGTYELLLTSPISPGQIVLGKFLGIAGFTIIMVGMTGIYALILLAYGNPEVGVMLSGFLGLLLLALAFVAIGLFASSLTENQIIAAVTGLVMTLLLFMIAWPAESAGDAIGPVLKYISVQEHFSELLQGVIETKSLIYFASMVVGWLFLTQRSVESIRWR